MLLTVTYGTASGQTAQVDVEQGATAMDVLRALSAANTLGIDAAQRRYVVSSPRLGRDLLATEQLGEAGIRENDLLTVDSSETGYAVAPHGPGRRILGGSE